MRTGRRRQQDVVHEADDGGEPVVLADFREVDADHHAERRADHRADADLDERADDGVGEAAAELR